MNENKGEFSDGYHTFNELYEHRNLLFIVLCLICSDNAWWKKGDFDNYFCLYLETEAGQISYHLPDKYFYIIKNAQIERIEDSSDAQWDGHTSNDVIKRLEKLAHDLSLDDE